MFGAANTSPAGEQRRTHQEPRVGGVGAFAHRSRPPPASHRRPGRRLPAHADPSSSASAATELGQARDHDGRDAPALHLVGAEPQPLELDLLALLRDASRRGRARGRRPCPTPRRAARRRAARSRRRSRSCPTPGRSRRRRSTISGSSTSYSSVISPTSSSSRSSSVTSPGDRRTRRSRAPCGTSRVCISWSSSATFFDSGTKCAAPHDVGQRHVLLALVQRLQQVLREHDADDVVDAPRGRRGSASSRAPAPAPARREASRRPRSRRCRAAAPSPRARSCRRTRRSSGSAPSPRLRSRPPRTRPRPRRGAPAR